MVHINFDCADTRSKILADHGCSLIESDGFENPGGWGLKEPKGGISFGNMTKAEAEKCAAVYVYLYYEKGIEYSISSHLAMGSVGHIITHEEWLAEWNDGEAGTKARSMLLKKWADAIIRWHKRYNGE